VQEDAPVTSIEQERFDKIAEALVAKLQDLPDTVVDDGVLEAGEPASAPLTAASGVRVRLQW
jgi:hypothetical protein